MIRFAPFPAASAVASSALVALASLVGACGNSPAPVTGGAKAGPADHATALAAFETVRSVFQHPRCQNCHPAGDAPLQGDDGRLHAQNVRRGPEGKGEIGEECSTCHGAANPSSAYGLHVPPGNVKGWHMPAPDMKLVFVGVAPGALCEQIKDPARNGGKDMTALRAHLDDPLVVWGWAPGFGRAPVPVPREQFLAAWETWAGAGAPCPAVATK
jgi:cytochrome c5